MFPPLCADARLRGLNIMTVDDMPYPSLDPDVRGYYQHVTEYAEMIKADLLQASCWTAVPAQIPCAPHIGVRSRNRALLSGAYSR